jgi:hypothetical protein
MGSATAPGSGNAFAVVTCINGIFGKEAVVMKTSVIFILI